MRLEFWRNWGGGVRSGISTGDKRLFYRLHQLASKARTDDTADGSRIQDQHPSNSDVVFVLICRRKLTERGLHIKFQRP